MSLIFADSFDHYSSFINPNGKYSSAGAGCQISTVSGQPRTGPGCCSITSGAFGPKKFHRRTTDLLVACAWNSGGSGDCIWICDSLFQSGSQVLRCFVNVDGSVSVLVRTNGPIIATSVPGLVSFGVYNSIAMRATNTGGINWYVRIYVNGALVLTTGSTDMGTSSTGVDGFQLMGPGGLPTCYIDDLYVLDCTDAVNNGYLGPLRVYMSPPTANGSVLWTPSAGTNWSNVNEIPPDGDTSYNSDGTVGQADQYLHPLNVSVPANSQIFAVQHCMDLEVDSGSRSVSSDVGSVVNANPVVLAAGYVIDTWPMDQNPITAAPWLSTSFPLLAGPSVTA